MIPIQLVLSGFLSYREPVELDFTGFELACISGPNGAGKSSLLDAITWVLFGQARKRDESLINLHPDVKAAEVTLVFQYEGNLYRVQRANPRGKASSLEFHIQTPGGDWKSLTERTLRDTQARVESTLRMDYDTFVNAAFFLQGKADQFTQQRAGDRKRILSSILGLEVWEVYRQKAAENRRSIEDGMRSLDGRLEEINTELREEESRRQRLKELEKELHRLEKARSTQEGTLEAARRIAATLAEQEKLVRTLERQLEASNRKLGELRVRQEERQAEAESYSKILEKAEEIQLAYQTWQQTREELERWDEVAASFREQERLRQGPLTEIETERARLEQEIRNLQEKEQSVIALVDEISRLEGQRVQVQQAQQDFQSKLSERSELMQVLEQTRDRLAEARAENPRLKKEMDELKERIDQLKQAEGVNCPLCGQPLSPQDRSRLIDQLTSEGTARGDRFRTNKAAMQALELESDDLQTRIDRLGQAEEALRIHTRELDQINGRMEQIGSAQDEWSRNGALRLKDLDEKLAQEAFAMTARQALAQIDEQLKLIGYDAAVHDRLRQQESEGRSSAESLRSLEKAQAALVPVEREMAALEEQIEAGQVEVDQQQDEYKQAVAALGEAQSQAPDLYGIEQELLDLQEQENRLRMEVGAARQKVLVLEDLKARRSELDSEREQLAQGVSRYRQLERAFGKDGVPALLIEQALPQIEAKANDILDRLSDGNMSVRFITQAAYKDTRREDLRETLDIQISDGAGTRDYEMYSGGEAFRVNFAIRLALSEVLAQRAGARLQTLVIDEGFGSQDNQGRQRLIEAINLVRQDFAKILVITHLDELKDAFPNRIEVEKTPQGSKLLVV